MLRGENRPNPAKISTMIALFGLSGTEAEAFWWQAFLAHIKPRLRPLVDAIRADLAKAKKQNTLLLAELARLGGKPPKEFING